MFRRLAELPVPLRGSIFKDSNVVQVSYSIRDHTQNVKRTVDASLVLASPEQTIKASSQDVPSDVIASVFSPSRQIKIVLRESMDNEKVTRRFVEVWKDGRLDSSIEVTDTHGSFYSDDFLGSMSFSEDEDAFLYTAEANPPSKDASDIDRFKFTPSFGEGLSTKKRPQLFVMKWRDEGSHRYISVFGSSTPNVHFGQAVFLGSNEIFATGYDLTGDGRLLGVKYCANRPMAIWKLHLPQQGTASVGSKLALSGIKVSSPQVSSRSPRVSPSCDQVFWLSSTTFGAHAGCSSLYSLDVKTNETRVVVDVVWEPSQPGGFPGLYLETLPQRAFIQLGGKLYIACHSIWGSRTKVLLIDVVDGGITDLTTDEQDGGELYSWSVLGTDGLDRILCSRSSPTKPHEIVLLQLDHENPSLIPSLRILDSPTFDDDLLGVLNDVTVTIDPIPGRFPTETIVYKPKTTDPSHVPPLITIPHGGPHSTTTTAFNAGTVALALEGFTLSLPNYTGSLGFGEKYVTALLGKCGSLDVEDCIASVNHLVKSGVATMGEGKQFISGGSHGGFLTGHLIGQYPDVFTAAALRNPVISVGELSTSDIPDWYYSEFGLPYTPKSLITPEVYETLFKASPIAYVDEVKAKVLLLIGGSDLRVAPTQGVGYYHALKGRGKKVEMLWFEGEGHPLEGVEATRVGYEVVLSWFINKST